MNHRAVGELHRLDDIAGFKTGGLSRTAGDDGINDRLGRQRIAAVAEQDH